MFTTHMNDRNHTRPANHEASGFRGRGQFRGRAAGSVMILAVATLALLVVIATAYLQIARVDRLATAELSQEDNNLEQVADAVVAQIEQTLQEDLLSVDTTTNTVEYFNPVPATANEPGDESYDYPWTNDDAAESRNQLLVEYTYTAQNGTGGTATGGHLDDAWLSASAPNFSTPTDPLWPHLTNLTGMYLRLPEPDPSNNSAPLVPDELVVTNTGADSLAYDTQVPITGASTGSLDYAVNNYDMLGADADGDGVLDSKWTWAPIRQMDGVSYVMAVRIVDNSSMVNLNAATAMTSDGGITFGAGSDIPRGYFPTNVDLTRLLSRAGTTSTPPTAWSTDLSNLLAYRNVTSATLPTPFGLGDPAAYNPSTGTGYTPAITRIGTWLDNVSFYGVNNTTRPKYAGNDERELRFRNGLNNIGIQATVESPSDGMETMLRGSSTTPELSYADVPGVSGIGPTGMAEYFQGGDDTNNPLTSTTDLYPEVRHMLTTQSGSTAFTPYYTGMATVYTDTTPRLKYDLVAQDNRWWTQTLPTMTNLIARLDAAFQTGNPGGMIDPTYLGLTYAELDQVSQEFALAIKDYMDLDSVPTGQMLGGVTYYGMETLPFLREVYVQAGYQEEDLLDMMGMPGTDGLFETWEFVPGSQAVAVEIGNPFDRAIPAADLNANIRVAFLQGGVDVAVYQLDGAGDLPPRDPATDSPQEQLIIYSNPTTPVDEGGFGSDLVSDLSLAGMVVDATGAFVDDPDGAATPTPPFLVNSTDISVELRVRTAGPDNTISTPDDEWIAYDRLTVANHRLPVQHIDPMATPDATQDQAHGQGSAIRAGEQIQYLSNLGKGLVLGAMRLPDGLSYRDTQDKLEDDDKEVTGEVRLNNFQIPIANRPIFSVAELGWIMMLGFTDEVDGDLPQRLSGLDGTTGFLQNHFTDLADGFNQTANINDRLFLDFDAGVPTLTGVPHAAMVMDQFTTLSPAVDNVDNDGDGLADEQTIDGVDNDGDGTIDEADELWMNEAFVPGTININTAPLHIAALGAPLPEPVADVRQLMQAVAAYRDIPTMDDPTTPFVDSNVRPLPGTDVRQEPGIASIGELMMINPDTPGSTYNMERYGTNTSSERGSTVDLFPMPETINPNPVPQNATDSPEERLARFQFLSQAFTTRSDIYTAYVLLRGYPTNNFRQGPVEQKRFFVVFDRSGTTGPNDSVRVIAAYEY